MPLRMHGRRRGRHNRGLRQRRMMGPAVLTQWLRCSEEATIRGYMMLPNLEMRVSFSRPDYENGGTLRRVQMLGTHVVVYPDEL